MTIYEAVAEALRKKGKTRLELSLSPKLVEKTSLGPSYFVL